VLSEQLLLLLLLLMMMMTPLMMSTDHLEAHQPINQLTDCLPHHFSFAFEPSISLLAMNRGRKHGVKSSISTSDTNSLNGRRKGHTDMHAW
jgi:hypothetical protein